MILKNKLVLATIIFTFIFEKTKAQDIEKEAVKATINRLFEGMRKGDSTIARSVFHQKAITQNIGFSAKTGKNYINTENRLDGFLKAIGTPHTDIWDEQPGEFDIKIDNQMAQVWVPYQFFLGGKFSHCGVDVFTLYNENYNADPNLTKSNWKILYLTYTMRTKDCIK